MAWRDALSVRRARCYHWRKAAEDASMIKALEQAIALALIISFPQTVLWLPTKLLGFN